MLKRLISITGLLLVPIVLAGQGRGMIRPSC